MGKGEIIALIISLAIIVGAGAYILYAKLKGKKCIGCPDSSSCTGRCSDCKQSCACNDNKENEKE